VGSARFQQLEGRVAQLRSHLLPADFSETAEYDDPDMVTVQTLSFRVLAHAEIEAYFEDRVVEIAKSALRSWKCDQKLCRSLLYLVAFSGREMRRPPESLAAPSENKTKVWPSLLDPTERLRECVTGYIRSVQQENHGIRERNLLALLLPIGVSQAELDPLLMADFDSFGLRRGEAAHTTSNPARVKLAPDPKAEYALIEGLLQGVIGIDEQLNALLTEACASEQEQAAE
jgi:hypothetical protein